MCTLKVLLVALWCLSVSVKSYAEVYSGSCGESVNWSLDTETGLLEITGSGEMVDYGVTPSGSFRGAPWKSHNYSIIKCTIENGVTSIGDYAFSYCTKLTSITIPNSVTSIGSHAFEYCTGLTSITIPEGVTSIGDNAFCYCTGLTNVTIPESVTSIGSYAFSGCTGLTSITIPESVTSIEDWAFRGCTGLTSITIPESVTSIGGYAFAGCTGLTNITIPESVTSIGGAAFSGCTGLTSITIPESVTSIGSYAFGGCTGLTSINVDKNNPNYCSQNGVLFTKDMKSINCVPAGKTGEYSIPNSVTSIGDGAFSRCTGLTSITIPESVTSIGGGAFESCTNIKTIYCRSQEPPVCDNSALDGIDTSNCTLFVPEGAEALYKAADQWKEFFFIEEITGIDTPRADDGKDTTYDIYDMSGRTVRKAATTTDGLKQGLYIINGRKVLVE